MHVIEKLVDYPPVDIARAEHEENLQSGNCSNYSCDVATRPTRGSATIDPRATPVDHVLQACLSRKIGGIARIKVTSDIVFDHKKIVILT
jgi:hypothetical protein